MSSLTLADDELIDLTRKRRPSAQVRALRSMGIEHRVRPDGSVAVLRAHAEEVLGGKRRSVAVRRSEINWED